MSLTNISNNTCRTFLVIVGTLIGSLSAQASTTYNFTSAPVYLGELQNSGKNEVQTTPGLLQSPNSPLTSPPIYIGSPITAYLSFTSPLAPNSTTPIHLESGGFNLLGATKGGVEGYWAGGSIVPISNDINNYVAGSSADAVKYDHYSAVDGQVTTDASGQISAWTLNYTLYGGDSSTFLTVDKSTNLPTPPNVFPFSQEDATVSISSNPASSVSLPNVVTFDGQPYSGSFTFNGADTAFIDQGSVQFRYYTQEAGTFLPVLPAVPEPETWAMMLAGLSLLGWRARRARKCA
ncbi:putative secreted protein with PEP-CTERM sorting signal [Nitrosospira sp. Nsp2]|uniref:PEP-CTERM sorting domain-containing protein n=1 Tax=Nitrosospira sp. Nsp2 TaxID=136548 RepID=UPI000D325CA3|nr:PEP-CTERM sorting domain-containing protein [Nitrosospira sp. Nsp2]PTR13634.1 putative secreted protein with PEP-CTERM sorting signal [Nitrosospira sp. Nsp2]